MTKNDKFRDVASKRMKTLTRTFAALGRCANRSNYEYGRAEVAQLFARLRREYETLEIAFREPQREFDFIDGPQAVAIEGDGLADELDAAPEAPVGW